MTEIGTQFAGYRIEAELGEGGFAHVYRAVDGSGRAVALKVLTPTDGDHYDPTTKARFAREVETLSRLRSPHVVRLLDHGESETGRLYLAFELLDGQDLVDLLDARGRLSAEEVVTILHQMLEVLDEAHRAGLLHRDLKPHNIRVVSERPLDVRLLDFGIARSTDDGHPSVTKTGEIIGTPRYMSPEQLMASPLGPASDIYSLGMVAFELLMGRESLAQNNVWSQVGRLQSGHLFSVTNLDTRHVALMGVIERMTARKIEDRFASARAVRTALDRPTPRPVPQPPPAPRTVAWKLPAAVVVGLILLTATAAVLLHKKPEPPARVVELPKNVLEMTAVSESHTTSTEGDVPDLVPPRPEHGSTGCGKPAPHIGRGELFGEQVYFPTEYEPYRAHPLLIVAHHKWDDPGEFMTKSGFAALADLRHFVVFAPNNGNNAWEQPTRFLPPLEAMIEDLKTTACIDARRIFVVGHSRGGRAAMAAACEPWATAVAVNSYLPKEDEYRERWWCERQVPTLWLSPSDSHMVPLDGTRGCVSPRITLADFEAAWRERNRCEDRASVDDVTGGSCRSWTCESAVRSCVLDGGHYWPGVTPHSIDVMNCQHQGFEEPEAPRFAIAEQIWSFFEAVPVQLKPSQPSDGDTSTPR